MTIDELKLQPKITRQDISDFFETIGKPGENREEKLEAMRSLNKQNSQGHDISLTAESYSTF